MKKIDRRSVVTGFLCGSVIAAMGLTVMPKATKAMPLAAIKDGVRQPEGLVEDARVVVHVHPRRHRHRRWRCWWHRGRRVCGWR
jgi:hypothetical protein